MGGLEQKGAQFTKLRCWDNIFGSFFALRTIKIGCCEGVVQHKGADLEVGIALEALEAQRYSICLTIYKNVKKFIKTNFSSIFNTNFLGDTYLSQGYGIF